MEIVKLNDIEYINCDDFFKKAPIYCKDSRNGRELIKNKKIKDFIYVRLKENKWIITDGKSYKYDKILFKKSFIDTIKEITDPIITEDKYESAPDIINLDNNEKFKDDEGNILEIETRGERTVNSIYFKVKDVMIGFGMDNLITTIITINTKYKENEHYKYFNCKKEINNKIKIKKELYLTYKGLLRVVHISRNNKFNKNFYIIKKWLDNFDTNNNIYNYKLNTNNFINSNKNGYIYIVTSDLLNFVKIGLWRGNISSLYSRYITYYGNNISIDYYYVNNVRKVENNVHKHYQEFKISNELFDKKYYNDYKYYINKII